MRPRQLLPRGPDPVTCRKSWASEQHRLTRGKGVIGPDRRSETLPTPQRRILTHPCQVADASPRPPPLLRSCRADTPPGPRKARAIGSPRNTLPCGWGLGGIHGLPTPNCFLSPSSCGHPPARDAAARVPLLWRIRSLPAFIAADSVSTSSSRPCTLGEAARQRRRRCGNRLGSSVVHTTTVGQAAEPGWCTRWTRPTTCGSRMLTCGRTCSRPRLALPGRYAGGWAASVDVHDGTRALIGGGQLPGGPC